MGVKHDRTEAELGWRWRSALGLALLWGLFGPLASLHAQDPDPDPPSGETQDAPVEPPPPVDEGEEGQDDEPGKEAPTPPATVVYEAVYHDLERVRELLESWRESASLRVEAVTLAGPGGAQLDVPAIQWGAAGEVPLAERPTVMFLGGLDGVSLSGAEAVLAVTAELLTSELPDGLCFVSVPWAAPGPLAETLTVGGGDGRTSASTDEDGDGAADEDGPDDVDGDGLLLEMLIEDPEGAFAFASDTRFLSLARAGDTPRFRRTREGRDDDQDGRFNEDPIGGTNLDRNFPVGWFGPGKDPLAGGYPLSDPVSRALADLILERRCVAVLVFQGNHGQLVVPGGFQPTPWPAEVDRHDEEILSDLFAQATGRPNTGRKTLFEVHGTTRGSAIDWIYAVPGALACEVAAWGPSIEAGPEEANTPSDATFEQSAVTAPPVSEVDRVWSRWLDDTRGGIGFVDWHPVDVGSSVRALVGGWEPLSRSNPPESSLPDVLAPMPAFVKRLIDALVELAVEVVDVSREGEICRVRVRIANRGELASGLWTGDHAGLMRPGVRVSLELPPGARLLAGASEVDLGRMSGLSVSDEIEWVILAAPGSVLSVHVDNAWSLPLVSEVKP